MITGIFIGLLFAICFGGLAWVLMGALQAGADAYSGAYSEDTAREFEDVFLFIPPKRIAEVGWSFAIACFVLVFISTGSLTSMRGFLVGVAAGTLAGFFALRAPTHLLHILKRRRLAKFDLQLGDTLVGMSNALRAGFSITQAFEAVVRDGENPIAQEFGVLLQQTRVGVSFSDALSNLDDRVGSEDLTLVIVAIETARRTGGNLTEIFEQIAATIRERLRIERRIRTLTAQGRLQGIIVGFMPVVIGVALLLLDPGLMVPFLHSTIGVVIIGSVAILISLGAWTIRKIIAIDV